MAERRRLTFASFDEVMPEVERLLNGHRTTGDWSLGQICRHLRQAFDGSIDGIPFKAPWLLRKTIAPIAFRHMMKTGRMRAGVKLPASALPKPGVDARAEAEMLRAAIQRYVAHDGPVSEHPFFDRISRDEWTRLHQIHCAHHLSFVHPAG